MEWQQTVQGISLVVVGGLFMGACFWPMKLMRTYQFEHWWFIAMLVGLVIGPWTVTLVFFPQTLDLLGDPVIQKALVTANILSLCWGVANVLCGLCYLRIGIALTAAILSGIGASVVVVTPMIFKASGKFKDAPDILSPTGAIVLAGVAVMLVGVVLASLAGFGRDRVSKKSEQKSGSFLSGLIMAVIAGFTSAGLWLAFAYCQGPIQERICAGEPNSLAVLPVWALGTFGGALVNLTFPMFLMTRNKSWGKLFGSGKELALSVLIGVQFLLALTLPGKGMIMLGTLGAAIGGGIQQAMQMVGGQGAGFLSGEWRGVYGRPRYFMFASIALLIMASFIMTYAK